MIHFTHNDLDALGCMLCVNLKYKDKITKVYHTYYGDFEKQVDDIIKNNDDIVIITDLSFAERPETLLKLIQNKKFVQLIDHHSYPKNFWEQFDKLDGFKRIINDQICASKTCYELFKSSLNVEISQNKQRLDTLCNLCKIIDVYDCWREESHLFDIAQKLNIWFWTKNIDKLCETIENNNYKLLDNAKQEIIKLSEQRDIDVKRAYDSNKVIKAGLVSFVFDNDIFNSILIKEMNEGQKVIVGSGPLKDGDFYFKVRIKQKSLDDVLLKSLRIALAGKITGHPNAFTYTKKLNNSLELTNEYKRITKEVMGYFDDSIPF